MDRRERNEAIIDALLSGRTLQSVADEFGLTRERVRQIAEARGVNVRRIYKRREEEMARKIRALVAENPHLSWREIAEAADVSEMKVYVLARRYGIAKPRCVKPPPKSPHRPEILRLLKEGVKYEDIVVATGVSYTTVCRVAREAGIRRKRGRRSR